MEVCAAQSERRDHVVLAAADCTVPVSRATHGQVRKSLSIGRAGGLREHAKSLLPDKVGTYWTGKRDLAALARRVVEADVPFLGACYGIGLLGLAMGGTVDRRFGEAPAAVEISLTERGLADPLLAGMPDPFHAIVGHKEACAVLPPGAVLLASSAGCPTQMFRMGRHVYATQFHPELDAESLERRLHIYAGHGYCEPEEVAPIVAQAESVDLTHVRSLLPAFVERFGRPAPA